MTELKREKIKESITVIKAISSPRVFAVQTKCEAENKINPIKTFRVRESVLWHQLLSIFSNEWKVKMMLKKHVILPHVPFSLLLFSWYDSGNNSDPVLSTKNVISWDCAFNFTLSIEWKALSFLRSLPIRPPAKLNPKAKITYTCTTGMRLGNLYSGEKHSNWNVTNVQHQLKTDSKWYLPHV